jgi:hypothetical protein
MGESDSNEQSTRCADGATGTRYSTADQVGHGSYRSVSRERVGIQTWLSALRITSGPLLPL